MALKGSTGALTGGSTPAALEIDAHGRQVGDAVIGINDVKTLMGAAEATPEPATSEPEPLEDVAEPEPDDYVRRPIPDGVLLDHEGAPSSPRELASKKAQLWVGIDCLCGDARRAIDELVRWQERLPVLDVRLVVPFRLSGGILGADQRPMALYDHGGLVSKALRLKGAASAVLMGADGLLAGGPVTSFGEVEAFVDDIAEQLAEAETSATLDAE